MPGYLARTGLAVFALLFAITFLTEQVAAGRALAASTNPLDLPRLREVARVPMHAVGFEVAVAGSETAATTAPLRAAAVAEEPAAVILASWYGPGFYGNRTACGQIYTPELLGVAHLSLPCGTTLTLTYGGRALTATVIDRGPYIAGRTLDLSNATRLALGCTDLCTLRMQIRH
ncbi:MAG TPA: septal ring lytic transglycosylase RlpA family protein [Candidatus Limnocylindria bacterium]|nr:septal ring lytic transglycosylase RlpA family protein [Candidatus Limnocylindria bacterium]